MIFPVVYPSTLFYTPYFSSRLSTINSFWF